MGLVASARPRPRAGPCRNSIRLRASWHFSSGTLFARLPAMASKPKHPYTIVRGGKVLDIAKRKAAPAAILIKGGTSGGAGRPGLAAPAGATVIDAKNRLMHPGLIN